MQTIVLYSCYIVLILLFSTAYNTSLIYCFVIWCLHTNKRRPCSSTFSGHPSSSFLLSPTLFLFVCLCWMVCPPFRCSCFPFLLYLSCFALLDGMSAFPRDLFPFVSHCILSCFPLLASPFVSHGAPSCFPLLDGVSAFLTSCLSFLLPIVSPTCMPVLDGASACPRSCLPIYPCLPLSPHMCACMFWMVCSPSRGLVSPCPFSRDFVYPCLPLFPYMCACVWWCVRLPDVLFPLFVSHCHSPYICL